jgi:DNA-directed RNA polymerase subunit M/transcription elongation factor TFIIS
VKKIKNSLSNLIACPKCGSNLVIITTTSYPNSFECKKCGNLFLKTPKSLVDD